ncbi:MAG: hypothetical protein WAO74_02650 [Polaribacter sp.]|uniref:NAD(P)/FAD-dependent oxidoreductase n=1 Tax=Polaribacter sp. TaxID=1920175 RepID=UPI003BAEEB0C
MIDEVAKIIQTHPKVAYKFKNASQVGNWRGWGIPYHFGVQKKSGNRFMLVGDAAGLANAFYKEGVGTGMMSGIICAKQIANCLGKDRFTVNFLETYDISLKKEFGKLLSFSEFVLKLTRKRSLFIFLARILKKKFEKRIKPLMLRRSY